MWCVLLVHCESILKSHSSLCDRVRGICGTYMCAEHQHININKYSSVCLLDFCLYWIYAGNS